MPGRTILDESAYKGGRYDDPTLAKRREILRETVRHLANGGREKLHEQARKNLARWSREQHHNLTNKPVVRVVPDDWGVATARVTQEFGACFAVLNMANAFHPGGAYVEGTAAQEENMFRRTDCHASITSDEMDPQTERYTPSMTALLSAENNLVYLDTHTPRVCFRGPEERSSTTLGYEFLPAEQVFPFYELRAAAEDLRGGKPFRPAEMAKRVRAQCSTLQRNNVRHAVLSAFGCGAFHNPAEEVAPLYKAAIDAASEHFDVIVFAIFAPGYGPDNFTPFAKVFA